ncbi:MAG: GntR family transcriptional regulator [Anaerolineaceae bacterium]|jgi:DNA-binding GntR family transcriptional regulator
MNYSEEIYKILKDEILSGAYPENSPLREVDLSIRFKASRTPVRDAIAKLINDGLVEKIPGSSAFVKGFSWEELREIFSIRQVLEAYATGLSAMFIPDATIQELDHIYDQMVVHQKANNFEEYTILDLKFHSTIIQFCGNERLIKLINSLNDQPKLTKLHQDLYNKGKITKSLEGHRGLIDALKSHDAYTACKIMVGAGQNIFGEFGRDYINRIFYNMEE